MLRVTGKRVLINQVSQAPASHIKIAFDNDAPAVEVMRPADLARRWQCSERHVRALISTGRLQSFKLGAKLLRIHTAEVERFERSDVARLIR